MATFWVLDRDDSCWWGDAIEVEADDHEEAARKHQEVWDVLEAAAQAGNRARATLLVSDAQSGRGARVFRAEVRVEIEYEIHEDAGADIDSDPWEG